MFYGMVLRILDIPPINDNNKPLCLVFFTGNMYDRESSRHSEFLKKIIVNHVLSRDIPTRLSLRIFSITAYSLSLILKTI